MNLSENLMYELNEKHGYFQFGDAQGDVSKAFANDVIAIHESIRNNAPDMLNALHIALQAFVEIEHARKNPNWFTGGSDKARSHSVMWEEKGMKAVSDAIKKAEGK